ncbi:MAG: bifunctional phosphoribosylaminoimidazolecarboxamide formyltransferase/IMP cyclohydrolase, partial [Actinomycetaceae bacterium UMB1218B]|nr:bifunctional phosphoribosylaminoimidazolecarboxamide formyltransferase/IMP cyclohydrolase [Actinomycetaceae bacterium UMB1218B]
IAEAGVPVTPVDDVTGFPEVLEGRVKTLHPMIHAGILADQRKADHREQISELGVKAFDLVICNLYPFTQTVAGGGSFDECVEQIDIGGPSMVRAAAKNHPSVAVVTSPDSYAAVIEAARAEGFTLKQRRELAARAFAHTATYDLAISGWFADQLDLDDVRDELDEVCETHLDASDAAFLESLGFAVDGESEEIVEADDEEGDMPAFVADAFERVDSLRYGENPHQNAAVYREIADEEDLDENELLPGIANARQLHGKAMSYNNYTDGDAALRAAYDHERPCVAIIKHANPCGIAVADDVAEAHRKAHACDPVSAFGGVIAVNRPVSVELAKQIVPIFTEVVLAPGYDEGALEVLSAKKNLRVLEVAPLAVGAREFKQISGGLLVQDRDDVDAVGDDPANWTLVAGEAADAATLADLEFAWRTVLLTSLVKFDGNKMRHLSAREFHQIAGRAGRAGFDTVGYVRVLAPEHEIEAARERAKLSAAQEAARDVRELKRAQKKHAKKSKGPGDGTISWTKATFTRLTQEQPEQLRSQFSMTHSMVLNVLAGAEVAGRDPGAHLVELAVGNDDRPQDSNPHLRRLGDIYSSLLQAGVVEHVSTAQALKEHRPRLRAATDLPDDFALNQPLSPFALAAIELLDPDSPSYALDVLSVVESVLDDPRPLLFAQRSVAKGEAVAAMKAEGMEYDERMEALESVTWPMPLAHL